MDWTQTYDPLGNVFLSTLFAALPVVVLLGGLAFFHLRAHVAALIGLASALAIAVGIFGMPAPLALATAGYGAAYGLLPIGWIVLNVIFLYQLTADAGCSARSATASPRSRAIAGCNCCSSPFVLARFSKGPRDSARRSPSPARC